MSRLERLTPLFAVVTLPAGILAAVFAGMQAALVVFVVGWLLLTPASAVLFGGPHTPAAGGDPETVKEWMDVADELDQGEPDGETNEDPIKKLRDRYAAGEIDEAELERRLDALLEMEDLEADDEEAIERAVEHLNGGEYTAARDERNEVERE